MTRTAPTRGFPESEFQTRTRNAQAQMQADGLDALLLMTEPEVRYFTGFQTLFWQSPTRPWFVIVPAKGKPIAVIPEIGADLMRRSWIDDIRTWSAPNPEDDGISLLADALHELPTNAPNIGILKGHETHLRMPLGDWETLKQAVPTASFQDAAHMVQSLRMVKSDAEIEKLRHICTIGSDTFETVPNFARSGTPLEQVFRDFRIEALKTGADDAPYVVGGAGPGGYADVISPPSQRPLEDGDVLMLDTGCSWDGYFCDFDRNWAIGQASDPVKRAYDVLWRATEAGIDAARPGNTCRDLFQAMSKVIKELDQSGGDIGRLGHGLGMQLTEQPSHAFFDRTVLKAGMVLTLEPSLSYGNGHMMVHEENIVITHRGAELLTRRAAPEIPVID